MSDRDVRGWRKSAWKKGRKSLGRAGGYQRSLYGLEAWRVLALGEEGTAGASMILLKKMMNKMRGEEEEVSQEGRSKRTGCQPPDTPGPSHRLAH